MAKIDVSKIVGYNEMSVEDKLKALEEFELETDYTGYVKKDLFDKTSSELAKAKKDLKAQMSADEQAKLEREEAFNKMQEELNALKLEKQLGDMTTQYMSLGYDEKLAKATAKAFLDGDMSVVFANQKAHQEAIEKKVKANLIDSTPVPNVDNSESVMTKEKFMKLSPMERHEFSVKNPDQYKAMYEN